MSSSPQQNASNNSNNDANPLTIGVFGGSFNPIHLGHALLTITTQQTKPVDKVVLVPVYKHAVKKDLLPFDDRVAMCRLAVAPFATASAAAKVEVSTIERDVGASNGAMLRGMKQLYPPGTRIMYICGDDFFRWMERPKGLETLAEVDGLIVQRRLHKHEASGDEFFKEPMDETKIRAVCARLGLELDFIYGELPHFSSTLVRRAPGHWRSFLPQSVTSYLDERPHLLEQLIVNLEADAKKEMEGAPTPIKEQQDKTPDSVRQGSAWVMHGLEAVHRLQSERGRAGLWLSSTMESGAEKLARAQTRTDTLLKEIAETTIDETVLQGFEEVISLAVELQQIPVWLGRDRDVLKKRHSLLLSATGVKGWTSRVDIVDKFNARIDVLIEATIRAFKEIRETFIIPSHNKKNMANGEDDDVPELLFKWCEGKEALGRLRAFVCAGGPTAPETLRSSVKMRDLVHQKIETKERALRRVMSVQVSSSKLATPEALFRLLEEVTRSEWSLMGCFAASTPLPLVHKLLQAQASHNSSSYPAFDLKDFFEASTSTIDFLLTFAKALAASGCASPV